MSKPSVTLWVWTIWHAKSLDFGPSTQVARTQGFGISVAGPGRAAARELPGAQAGGSLQGTDPKSKSAEDFLGFGKKAARGAAVIFCLLGGSPQKMVGFFLLVSQMGAGHFYRICFP